MQNDPAKAFDVLYGALREYHAIFFDATMKACGFFLLVMGWVLTSEKARELAISSSFNRRLAIAGLVLPLIAVVVMAVRGIRSTTRIGRELDALQYFPRSYYDHRIITPSFAVVVISVAISPCIVLILFLLSLG